MNFVVVLLLLGAVAVFVTMPLRRRRFATRGQAERIEAALTAVGELEAAKEAKYREIRDAELDHATGKLSDADHGVLDRSLRAEAVAILKALDRARERLDAEADTVSAPLGETPVPEVPDAAEPTTITRT
jgi:type II secretory pathway component PulM